MKKLTLLIMAIVVCVYGALGQQDPLYALYMTNMQAINPAYGGMNSYLSASVNYRSQWANLPQNPETITASVHSSLFKDYLGGGVVIVQDKIGVTKNTETYMMGSYQIKSPTYSISFGLQFGILSQQFDYSDLSLDPLAQDPLLAEISGTTRLNFGTGIAFRSANSFVGISIPRMAQPVISAIENAALTADKTVYMVGSTLIPLDIETEIQPSVLVKYTTGQKPSFDVGLNGIYNHTFLIGGYTREFTSFGARLGLKLPGHVDVQYSFELFTESNEILKNRSQEISVKLNTSIFQFHEVEDTWF